MFELILRAPQGLVEEVSDLLIDELDALSVSVEDADANTDSERAMFGEPGMPAPAPGWERSTLQALFETEALAEQAAAALLSAHGAAGLHLQALGKLANQDWVRLTQQQFQPVQITPEFWVVPSWHKAPEQATCVMRLDPGLAFGTGTHPTTRMCLRWLAHHANTNTNTNANTNANANAGSLRRVLDYGCGSGILAIGAALFGAQEVHAVDIDPAAVQATQDNARDNGVVVHAGLPDQAKGTFDLVLANILATPLKLLAPLLSQHVAPGGWLVMAGILDRQAEDITLAYAGFGLVSAHDHEDGWVLMCGQRHCKSRHPGPHA